MGNYFTFVIYCIWNYSKLDLIKENLNDTWKQTGRRSKGEVCSEKRKSSNQCETRMSFECLGECVQDNYGDFSPKLI